MSIAHLVAKTEDLFDAKVELELVEEDIVHVLGRNCARTTAIALALAG